MAREHCSTIGCKSPATERISYHYRGEEELTSDLACTPCADGYARRVVLKDFVRVPLMVWVSTGSHRARHTLQRIIPDLGPEYGVWPKGDWPRGSYYMVPATRTGELARVKGLRVLQGQPKGGRIFKRVTSF